MESEKVSLKHLMAPDKWKQVMRFCKSPRSIADVAAHLRCSYAYASNMLSVLLAGDFVTRGTNKGKCKTYTLHKRVMA